MTKKTATTFIIVFIFIAAQILVWKCNAQTTFYVAYKSDSTAEPHILKKVTQDSDTIPAKLLVTWCDRCTPRQESGFIVITYPTWVNDHPIYLDDRKKRLPKEATVWMYK